MTQALETSLEEKAVPVPGEDKRIWAERVLTEILRLMELPARLDFKDAEDGSLSVALLFETEVPGVARGKRSFLMDSLQLLVNKIVNRPGVERRWVNLGAYEHPLPRGQKKPVAAPVPVAAPAVKPAKKGKVAPVAAPAPVEEVDEGALKVSADKALAAAGKALLEKSAQFGRHFALFAVGSEDRARLLQAGAKAKGVKISTAGEGLMRRVVLTPEVPKPMPKFVLPDWDEEEEEG